MRGSFFFCVTLIFLLNKRKSFYLLLFISKHCYYLSTVLIIRQTEIGLLNTGLCIKRRRVAKI